MNTATITIITKVASATQRAARAKLAVHLRRLAAPSPLSPVSLFSGSSYIVNDFLVKEAEAIITKSWEPGKSVRSFKTDGEATATYPPVFLNMTVTVERDTITEVLNGVQAILLALATKIEYGDLDVVASGKHDDPTTYWIWELSDPGDLYLKDKAREEPEYVWGRVAKPEHPDLIKLKKARFSDSIVFADEDAIEPISQEDLDRFFKSGIARQVSELSALNLLTELPLTKKLGFPDNLARTITGKTEQVPVAIAETAFVPKPTLVRNGAIEAGGDPCRLLFGLRARIYTDNVAEARKKLALRLECVSNVMVKGLYSGETSSTSSEFSSVHGDGPQEMVTCVWETHNINDDVIPMYHPDLPDVPGQLSRFWVELKLSIEERNPTLCNGLLSIAGELRLISKQLRTSELLPFGTTTGQSGTGKHVKSYGWTILGMEPGIELDKR